MAPADKREEQLRRLRDALLTVSTPRARARHVRHRRLAAHNDAWLQGCQFIKYGRTGFPHEKWVCLNISGNLHWCAPAAHRPPPRCAAAGSAPNDGRQRSVRCRGSGPLDMRDLEPSDSFVR
jgi:hypothetical protein